MMPVVEEWGWMVNQLHKGCKRRKKRRKDGDREQSSEKQRLREILGACELVCAFVKVCVPVCAA
jgi:hypothetical protein